MGPVPRLMAQNRSMQDEDSENSQLDSPPEFDGVLEMLAHAPRPRMRGVDVRLPEALNDAFANEPESDPARTPRPGDVVDARYRIDGLLGSGGMGVVFSASHLATGRRVALKWLQLRAMYRTETERQAAIKRFVREAQAAGRIRHPNVVDVHDAGTSPQAPYLVMELLEGETLRTRIDRAKLSWQEALRLLLPAMDGVGEAHRRGVVHRDLKPDNVFLARETSGTVCPKVLDFGISRLQPLDASDTVVQASLTRTGAVIGTPAYMPLEQLRAEGDVDARTDVYALGVVLYEMLSQKRPYVARNAADFAAVMASARPTPLSKYCPELKGSRERAVMKALERNRADRHASVQAFVAALSEGERSSRVRAGVAVTCLLAVATSAWLFLSPVRPSQPEQGPHVMRSSSVITASRGAARTPPMAAIAANPGHPRSEPAASPATSEASERPPQLPGPAQAKAATNGVRTKQAMPRPNYAAPAKRAATTLEATDFADAPQRAAAGVKPAVAPATPLSSVRAATAPLRPTLGRDQF
jgi:serine/threonine protein kinase